MSEIGIVDGSGVSRKFSINAFGAVTLNYGAGDEREFRQRGQFVSAGDSIGRVGGLAVALGVGAAILVGAGAAWADDAGSAGAGAASSGRPSESESGTSARVGKSRLERRSRANTIGSPATTVVDRSEVARSTSGDHPIALDKTTAAATSPVTLSVEFITAQDNSIVTAPAVRWDEGILRGTAGATSTKGLPLTYAVVDSPNLGGKITFDTVDPQGEFTYLPYMTTLTSPSLNEQFSILVSETTPFNAAMASIPVLGLLAPTVFQFLQQVPILSGLLAPLIGSAQVVRFNENPYTLTAGRPVGFTYLMPSFDGTPISVNYFPARDVASGAVDTAPLVLKGPSVGQPGSTDPYALGETPVVAEAPPLSLGLLPLLTGEMPGYSGTGGYNVVTWDARGTFASGGIFQLDNPFWEGRDASAIISWASGVGNPGAGQIAMEAAGDPYLGMIGGSYAGGIQLVAAGTPDRRVDAIVPSLAWNSLNSALYPSNIFKSSWSTLLLLNLARVGARLNSGIYSGILMGNLIGVLSESAQALLAASGPTMLVNNVDVPTLLIQGIADGLFTLEQAVANAQQITTTNPHVPVKMIWFCGGHGLCQDPDSAEQWPYTLTQSLRWLDQYVAVEGTPADSIPEFQWFDQTGRQYSSSLMPYEEGFNSPISLSYQGTGGLLGIVPVLGGSGPVSTSAPFPPMTFAIGQAAEARNALNLAVETPVGTQIAGAPTVSFSYSGIGTSRAVFAQLVDNNTGRVVGNVVTPVPVTLDGRRHTVEIPMENIAYTSYGPNDSLTLQITSSATTYENFTSFGLIDISNIHLELPTVAESSLLSP